MAEERGHIDMSCRMLLDWLDAAMPAAAPTAAQALAHAAACATCAAELRAAREIDGMFEVLASRAATAVAAPPTITGVVMARIAALESLRGRIAWEPSPAALESAMPWWVRAAAQPTAALALMLAAVVVWQPLGLLSAAVAMLTGVSAWMQSLESGWIARAPLRGIDFSRPEVAMGVGFALAPALAWAVWSLWRWGERRA
jgi:hypothetical protein